LSWSADKRHLSLLCQVLRQQCVVDSRLWFHGILLSIASYNSQDYGKLLSIIVIYQLRERLFSSRKSLVCIISMNGWRPDRAAYESSARTPYGACGRGRARCKVLIGITRGSPPAGRSRAARFQATSAANR
jgi:hypothetical protein